VMVLNAIFNRMVIAPTRSIILGEYYVRQERGCEPRIGYFKIKAHSC
jgi:hypothetical protein